MRQERRLRVTFLLPGFGHQPGGGARIVNQHANGLVQRGHEVNIVHIAHLPGWRADSFTGWVRGRAGLAYDLMRGPPVAWQGVDPRVRLLYHPRLDLDRLPPSDAVVATAWMTAKALIEAGPRRAEGFYFLQSYETWMGDEEEVNATWRSKLHKIGVARWLIDVGLQLGVDDMEHVPNAIDLERFRLVRPITPRPSRVAMLHSPLRVKGADIGIAALERAKARVPQLEAVLFGTGRRPSSLPDWMEYERDPKPSRLVDDVYNGSALYLCPSRMEGWGLPSAEAMACGCALVATDNGGVRDYAVHGETALLVLPEDPTALADALVRLLLDEALRVRLATAGRERISQFSWTRSHDLFERALLRRIQQPSGGRLRA